MAGETATAKDRKPVVPAPVMADKGRGTRSKTPELPSEKGCHVPVMAESVMAAPRGKAPDGMAKYAQIGMENRQPVTAESFNKRQNKSAS